MKVLAVDDSITILQIIKDTLSTENFDVETATNGAEALFKYAKFRPDIVTLDVTMPLMDGYETLSKILNFDKNAKVIMLTATEHWALVERCLARGAVGYISKPFRKEELLNTINDPWHSADKNTVTLFSLACNKISSSLQKIFPFVISVELKKIEVSSQTAKQISTNTNNSTIIAVSQVQEKLEMKIPSTSLGFITEFTGQMHGLILSHMNSEHVKQLLWKSIHSNVNDMDASTEFFHTINTKIFSVIVDASGRILNIEPTQKYDDSTGWDSFGKVIKGNYEIVIGNVHFPIEIQLWSNSDLASIRRM